MSTRSLAAQAIVLLFVTNFLAGCTSSGAETDVAATSAGGGCASSIST